jgi:CBS domain containing-hemolysin-like protein
MSTIIYLLLISLVIACLASVASRSLARFSRHRLKAIGEKRNGDKPNGDSLLREIMVHQDRVAQAVESLRVMTATVVVACTVLWMHHQMQTPGTEDTGLPSLKTLFAAAGLSSLMLLFAELWLPWGIASLWAEGFLYYTWRIWYGVSVVLGPLVGMARFSVVLLHRLAGKQPADPTIDYFEEEIRTIVTEGHREGLLEEDARDMIEGIIELADVEVSSIMTPRTDMVCLPLSTSTREALEFVISISHTRVPVFDKNRDDIVGILYAKDLLPELARGDEHMRPLADLLREPYFVPETKKVDDLLQEFQRTRNHMAIVLDEYGGVSGLVTIEDVLEEIVGEIIDEYDPELVEGIRRIDDDTAEVLGRVHVDEANERLGLSLPDDGDYDTVAGLVFHELGRIPSVGEQITYNGVRFTVLEASRRRIERLRLERLDQEARRETA